jgi:F0F1-type ATP synthase assembly protein I
MQNARINVRRLAKSLFLSLLLPVFLAGIVDAAAGTYPWFLITAAVICIPLSTVVVIRMALAELDSVIRQVAPKSLPEPALDAVPDQTGGN